ncbi:heavy-metal-associated domain-containing protein [Lichenicoccus sp.]|uniref:heavy-metal-associated domain-containing protein n=1 Tax=Lichenicoccus sp. TaxID=2781899 RepID=UPI003D0F333C
MDTSEPRIEVHGMTCAHCVRAVTAAASAVPGVARPQVDLATGILSWQGEAHRSAIRAAVAQAGYVAGE